MAVTIATGKRMRVDYPVDQRGFTYLAVLYLVALGGLLLAQVGNNWSQDRQREKEKQLLFIGNQYRQAIAGYYQQTPGEGKIYPPQLEVLLEDNRFNPPRRHLRRLYRDPMTGAANWGLVDAPEGGIMGVFSQSSGAPIKMANFRDRDRTLEKSSSYQDWQFSYRPQVTNTADSTILGRGATR